MVKFIPYLLAIVLFSCDSGSKQLSTKKPKPGNLQFFEVYLYSEVSDKWQEACKISAELEVAAKKGEVSPNKKMGLNAYVQIPMTNTIGYIKQTNMRSVDSILAIPQIAALFPKDLEFMWEFSSYKIPTIGKVVSLHFVKTPPGKKAFIQGKDILDARAMIYKSNHKQVITLTMNHQGNKKWEIMTRKNVGRAIAITMDNKVLSCWVINEVIASGSINIFSNFKKDEAEELAARINLGRR